MTKPFRVSALLVRLLAALASLPATAVTYSFKQAVPGMAGAAGASCALPWGGTLTSGTPLIAYPVSTVPYGSTCAEVSVSCANGALAANGATAGSCSVAPQSAAIQAFGTYRAWSDGTFAASCLAYRTGDASHVSSGATGTGTYRLTVRGSTVDATCDMTSDGGGWTRVVRQFEATPVLWTGATDGSSYTLSAAQIPAHTQVAFGKDEQATAIDYVTWQYSVGDIPLVRLTSPKTGKIYDIHRSRTGFYYYSDPESTYFFFPTTPNPWGDGDHRNQLTFDLTGGMGHTWAFAPQDLIALRGMCYNGVHLAATSEAYAWTVWVR